MRNSFCNLLMSNENTLPEPVECLMHAQDYLSKTRGEVSARKSMAWWILQRALMHAQQCCIDDLIGDTGRRMGLICPCTYHTLKREYDCSAGLQPCTPEPAVAFDPPAKPAKPRDGKMAATGERNDAD